MLFQRGPRKAVSDEAEKPFWISYSDLMTACMTLFLVVMAVTIVSLEQEYGTKEHKHRSEQIKKCFGELKSEAVKSFPQAKLDYNSDDAIRINLGEIVNFEKNDYKIGPEASQFLRRYVPSVLSSVKSSSCSEYFRRVVVEGYTDTDGDYLPNLDLSLKRSKEVVCSLANQGTSSLGKDVLNDIRDLFLVGGFSFNSFKPTKAENRVVVLKLEFWQVAEKARFEKENPTKVDLSSKPFGSCY